MNEKERLLNLEDIRWGLRMTRDRYDAHRATDEEIEEEAQRILERLEAEGKTRRRL